MPLRATRPTPAADTATGGSEGAGPCAGGLGGGAAGDGLVTQLALDTSVEMLGALVTGDLGRWFSRDEDGGIDTLTADLTTWHDNLVAEATEEGKDDAAGAPHRLVRPVSGDTRDDPRRIAVLAAAIHAELGTRRWKQNSAMIRPVAEKLVEVRGENPVACVQQCMCVIGASSASVRVCDGRPPLLLLPFLPSIAHSDCARPSRGGGRTTSRRRRRPQRRPGLRRRRRRRRRLTR